MLSLGVPVGHQVDLHRHLAAGDCGVIHVVVVMAAVVGELLKETSTVFHCPAHAHTPV